MVGHTTSEAFQALRGLHTGDELGMLEVRENEISLRKWSLVVLRICAT